MSKAPDGTSTHKPVKSDELMPLPPVSVKIISFGYKEGPPPEAGAVFDMRFLKNPYWVEELRPLTGLHKAVQDYVMNQPAASEFLDSLLLMLQKLIPRLAELEVSDFSIAFGCTGGQHRSTTIAELLAQRLKSIYPQLEIELNHRELTSREFSSKSGKEDSP